MSSIKAVVVHPPVAKTFKGSEHPAGQLPYIGDALGVDVTVEQWVDGYMRPFIGDGSKNEDWYGWNEPVLAPFDGVVERVSFNEVVNTPGTLGKSPSTSITFKRGDGVRVLYAHLQAVAVKEGDAVSAGQHVARIGNNGMAWNPHVHIGAWKGKTPLQLRFDLEAMGKLHGFDKT